ncbi:hypothetical protein TruAng_002625 [Truncatella angustata]|nr:hypothetical protein TruAng_002625 [Truncatella angustata]
MTLLTHLSSHSMTMIVAVERHQYALVATGLRVCDAHSRPLDRPQPVVLVSTSDTRLESEEVLERIRRFKEEDDVFNDGFLSDILLIAGNHSSNHTRLLTGLLGDVFVNGKQWHLGAVYSLATSDSHTNVPSGPYFVCGNEVFQAWKLYVDESSCFQTTVLPTGSPYRFKNLDSIGPNGTGMSVAVPSRMYARPSAAKPLAGVRVGIKDNFKLAGTKSSLGNRSFLATYNEDNETAAFIKTLINLGAVIIGKTKMAAFASGEKPCDWFDFQCPFNPRGDAHLEPGASSTGSATATAAYNWMDICIGTDKALIRHALASTIKEFKTFPRSILYPTDFFPQSDKVQQGLRDNFVNILEDFLGVKKTSFSIADRWAANPPEEAEGKSLAEFASKSGYTPFYYDIYHEYDVFRDDHFKKFGTRAYVSPSMQWRWDRGAEVTTPEAEKSHRELTVLQAWFVREILRPDEASGSTAILVLPVGPEKPDYRDVFILPAPRVGIDALGLAAFLRLPQLVIPIGQVEYDSRVSGRRESFPFSCSVAGAHGSDLMLIGLAMQALRSAKFPTDTVLEGGLRIICSGVQSPTVDIVSIPSLPQLLPSYQPRDQASWIRDVFTHQFPTARVILFHYDFAKPPAADACWLQILREGTTLLYGLIHQRSRPTEVNRPLVFLCHSFGGMVLKQALLSAKQNAEFGSIFDNTIGVLFFGCIHNHNPATFETTCLKCVALEMRIPLLKHEISTALKGSDKWSSLKDTLDKFRQLDIHFPIWSYCESRKTSYKTHRLRPAESSIVGFPSVISSHELYLTSKQVCAEPLARLNIEKEQFFQVDMDHVEISSFPTRGHPLFQHILVVLNEVLAACKYTQTSEENAMDDDENRSELSGSISYGKSDILDHIYSVLNPDKPGQKPTKQAVFALCGLGGVGKTQVAIRFAMDYISSFQAVLFAHADEPTNLLNDFVRFAVELGLVDLGEPDQLYCCEQLKRWFEETGKFYGTDPSERASYRDKLQHEQREAARQIVYRLGCLPLGIYQAANLIVNDSCLLTDFLSAYDYRDLVSFPESTRIFRNPNEEPYRHTLLNVWSMNFESLSQNSQKLVNVFSFLNPDNIELELLASGAEKASRAGESGWSIIDSTRKLTQQKAGILHSSLMDQNSATKTLSMHRLVQAACQHRMEPENRQKAFEMALSFLHHMWPVAPRNNRHRPDLWPSQARLLPHVLSLCRFYADSQEDTVQLSGTIEFAELLYNASWYNYERGTFEHLEPLLHAAEHYCLRHENCEVVLADIYGAKASVATETNRQDAALQNFQLQYEFLNQAIKKNVIQLPNIRFCFALGGMGNGTQGMGQYKDAEQWYRKCYNAYEGLDGDRKIYGGNLAFCLIWQGKLDEAQEVLNSLIHAAADMEFKTGYIMYPLGNLQIARGELDKAFKTHLYALKVYQQTLSDKHHRTADLCHKLGWHYHARKEYAESVELLNQALAVFEARPTWYRNERARTKYKLGCVLQDMGKVEDGSQLINEAEQIRRDILGPGVSPGDEHHFDELVMFCEPESMASEYEARIKDCFRCWPSAGPFYQTLIDYLQTAGSGIGFSPLQSPTAYLLGHDVGKRADIELGNSAALSPGSRRLSFSLTISVPAQGPNFRRVHAAHQSHIAVVEGFLAPESIRILGEKYQVRPEFFIDYLEPRYVYGSSTSMGRYELPNLPSKRDNIVHVRFMSMLQISGETRPFSASLASRFEQRTLLEIDGSDWGVLWLGLLLLDNGRPCEDVDLPWAGCVQDPRSAEFVPIIPYNLPISRDSGMGLQDDLSSKQHRPYHPAADIILSAASSVTTQLLAEDPFYILSCVYHAAARTRIQLLSFIESDITECSSTNGTTMGAHQSLVLDQLRFDLQLVRRVERFCKEDLANITQLGSAAWPRTEKLAEIEKLRDQLQSDYAYLIEQCSSLVLQCETASNALVSLAQWMDAREGIRESRHITNLTVLAFLFIPLTYITSVLGMNVQGVMEGVPIWVWGGASAISVIVTTVVVVIMRWKRWEIPRT